MKPIRVATLLCALGLAALPGGALAGPVPATGLAAGAGWQVKQGRWTFEGGAAGALTCQGQGTSSLVFRRGPPLRDLDASVQVMFSGPQSSAGIVLRARGRSYYHDMTFYQLEWYTEGRHHGRRLSLMKKFPRWKQLVTPVIKAPPIGRWITLRVRAQGDRITCHVDGEQVFEIVDRSLREPGAVGLHVFQARTVTFRNFTLKALDGQPPIK